MKNIYITWHYTTHGAAFLKHILSEFYTQVLPASNIFFDKLDQVELNTTFDKPFNKGFLFDEIVYLTAPQEAFDGISSRRFSYRNSILDDPEIKNSNLVQIYAETMKQFPEHNLDGEFNFVENKYPQFLPEYKSLIWRNIQHYPVREQIKWLNDYSNFKNVYSGKFKVFELNVNDLRDEKQISDEVGRWGRQYFSKQKNFQPIVNVSLGSNETQVVWHILAEGGQLPENTRFIKTYDDKSDRPENRFKRFSIKEIPTNLVSSIGAEFKIFKETQSPSRDLANRKMKAFLKSGFSILLIGERGIGKSQIASEARKSFDSKNPFIEANCASFDEDSKAEAELFGYEKGAFTGANSLKKGLLEEADGGILFLDEIHHLSKIVQAKLMKALQTDNNNKMSIRRMGNNKEIKVECRLIFATNKSITELRIGENALLADFYDRIVQHVIHIPPLRETTEDREKDWAAIWAHLKFGKKDDAPKESELINWIKQLPLYGNYRDLQKIAIYYNAFRKFDDDTIGLLDEKSAFHYAKSEFEKYHSPVGQGGKEKFNFDINKTTKEMIADYLFELQDWAVRKFHGRKAAIEHFSTIGDTVSEKTFNDWKNRKSIKN